MAKLYLDELESALSFTTFNTLSQDSRDATSTGNHLVDFIEQSEADLKGEQWDQVRGKMAEFQQALGQRAQVADHLGAAIEEALQMLKDYMEPDEMLDSSRLEEYREAKKQCEDSIETLKGMLNETKEVVYEDPDNPGEYLSTWVPMYDAEVINAQIAIATATLQELDRIIKKIGGLDEIYDKAERILEEAYQEVLAFQRQVQSITPSAKYVYER